MCGRLFTRITVLSALLTTESIRRGLELQMATRAVRIGCTVAHSCAAERRLTLTSVHTPLGHSYTISLLPFAVLGLSSRLTWHDFACFTMAQKVHVLYTCAFLAPHPLFFRKIRASGPYMPVAPDPPSKAQATFVAPPSPMGWE